MPNLLSNKTLKTGVAEKAVNLLKVVPLKFYVLFYAEPMSFLD